MGPAMNHVGLHQRQTLAGDQLLQCPLAEAVCRHLGLQVGQQLIGVAHRMGPSRQAGQPTASIEDAIFQKGQIAQQQALLLNAAAEGGHRAGGDAAHIGVMATAGNKEQRRFHRNF